MIMVACRDGSSRLLKSLSVLGCGESLETLHAESRLGVDGTRVGAQVLAMWCATL